MKAIFLIAFALLLNSVRAQQPFQGTIVYVLHTPQEKTDPELTILYGPNKIKVKFKEKEDYDKTYLLIDLDSGKFYTINTDTKTFQVKKLTEAGSTETVATSKTIAGYKTNPVNVTSSGFGGLVGFSGTTVLYAASDLYYPIPKKHAGIPQLVMINDNHIVLGAEIKLGLPGMNEEVPDSISQQMNVTVEAKKVEPQALDLVEFSIPLDFTRQSNNYYSMTDTAYITTDSTMMYDTTMMADTVAVPTPKTKTPAKTKSPTPKKTTPSKTEAIKPKKTQTNS